HGSILSHSNILSNRLSQSVDKFLGIRASREADRAEANDAPAPATIERPTLRHLSIDTVPHIPDRSPMSAIPEKPALEGLENKWGERWEQQGTYLFDRAAATAQNIFSIDTPPPTASGSLHIGHVFSYTHTDV